MSILSRIFKRTGKKAASEVDDIAVKVARQVEKNETKATEEVVKKAAEKTEKEAAKGAEEVVNNVEKNADEIKATRKKKEPTNPESNPNSNTKTNQEPVNPEEILKEKMKKNRAVWEKLKESKKNFVVKDSTESDLKLFRGIGDDIIEGTNVTGNQFGDLIENGGFQSKVYGIQSKDGSFIPITKTVINPYAKEGELKEATVHLSNRKPKMRKEIREKPSKVKEDDSSIKDKFQGTQNFVYKMAAMGVGGGLVLNLANNKGQQTNNQLYGM